MFKNDYFGGMKNILLVLLILPLISFSQRHKEIVDTSRYTIFPEENKEVLYTGVVNVDSNLKKDELYVRARAWFVNEYKSAKDVIQMEDKQAGEIIGKGLISAIYTEGRGLLAIQWKITIWHTVSVFVKDGKYKYEIKDINGSYYSETFHEERPWNIGNKYISYYNQKYYVPFLNSVDEKFKQIISDLNSAMNAPLKNKDW
ncbi:MAG TPA: DUF4468 domain-containing protein [Chitinophagaceae bacterium]